MNKYKKAERSGTKGQQALGWSCKGTEADFDVLELKDETFSQLTPSED